MKDLKKLLDNVIRKYGKNALFPVPDIKWTERYTFAFYGVYQFWDNTIMISKVLDSDSVPDEVLEGVIFHELTHQLYYGHGEAFMKRMDDFTGHADYQKWLDDYQFDIGNAPLQPYDFQLNPEEETLYVEIPFFPSEPDKYLSYFMYYNHLIIGQSKKTIPAKYRKKKLPQVIFFVRQKGTAYTVAWAKNVYFCDGTITIKHPLLGPAFKLDYFMKQSDIQAVMPSNVLYMLSKDEMPLVYKADGCFTGNDLAGNIHSEIITDINNYDFDIVEMGSFDERLSAAPVIETDDISQLIEMSKCPDIGDRAVWIMNTAVKKEHSFRTVKALGDAYLKDWIFDKARENYAEAITLAKKEKLPEKDYTGLTKLIEGLKETESLIAMP